jgi:hypothetical protein
MGIARFNSLKGLLNPATSNGLVAWVNVFFLTGPVVKCRLAAKVVAARGVWPI